MTTAPFEPAPGTAPQPNAHAAALEQQADGLLAHGLLHEAAEYLERATRQLPDAAGLWNRLGMVRHAMGQFEPARVASDRLIALLPQSATAWVNRARTFEALQLRDDALACVDRALECDPQNATNWVHRGMILGSLQRHPEALAAFDRALAFDQRFAAAWAQRAGPLRVARRFDEALASSDRAVALDPELSWAWEQRGYSLLARGETAGALECLDTALRLAPANADARFSRGTLLLTLGQFERGWQDYEVRISAALTTRFGSGAPIWQKGEKLGGRTIALRAEQGLGDTLQFSRYAALLAQAGESVVLSVPPVLAGLLESLPGGVHVVSEDIPLLPHALQCPLLSLPHRVGTTVASVPSNVPYLSVAPGLQRAWRARLADLNWPARVRIGLAYSGQSKFTNDHNRSIATAQIAPLIDRFTNVEWHLLQKDVRAEDSTWLAASPVVDHRTMLEDFRETAALASCMDLVISVDTSIAHLAGAMALPLYVLLPFVPDWRWMLDRADSPWYPTARLFRQPAAGAWEGALKMVGDAIDQFLAAGTDSVAAGASQRVLTA